MTFFTISHETKHDPQPEEAGRIIISARIFGEFNQTLFTTIALTEEFINEDNDECQSKQDLNYFLMEARLDNEVVVEAMLRLVLHVDEVTSSASHGFFRGRALLVRMDFFPSVDEAVRFSVDQTSNIRFKPASKFVVESLTRKIYSKINCDNCIVCLEEFKNGTRVVTLPCGHEFDDECIVKWFETSHVCPLCRFELPCEPSIN